MKSRTCWRRTSPAQSRQWRRRERDLDRDHGPMVNVRDAKPGLPQAPLLRRASFSGLRASINPGRYRGVLLSAASLALAFLIWQLLSTFIFNPFLIPPPLEVIRTAIPMMMSGEIFAGSRWLLLRRADRRALWRPTRPNPRSPWASRSYHGVASVTVTYRQDSYC